MGESAVSNRPGMPTTGPSAETAEGIGRYVTEVLERLTLERDRLAARNEAFAGTLIRVAGCTLPSGNETLDRAIIDARRVLTDAGYRIVMGDGK